MRRLPMVIWLVVVLVAAVAGCGGAHYDGRLMAADSLIRSNPDSALAVLEALPRASLTTEGDRAYHGLLLAQSRYKAYVVATSDSDINRALNYYRAYSREREKLTRAYLYKGAVMEELGHPDSAMLYYKHAEATAAPDDYFNLGYSNLRIAELYQAFYNNDSAVVDRMRRAYYNFAVIEDTNYMITTIGAQGLFPKIVGRDSAFSYLERSIALGKAFNSPKRFQYQSKLAGMYFFAKDYHRAKNLAMDIVNEGGRANENLFYYYAARSYINLSDVDSALWLQSIMPPPVTAVDSMNNFLFLADLSKVSGRHQDYNVFINNSEIIHNHILEASLTSKLNLTELSFDAKQYERQLRHWNKLQLLFVIFISLVAIIVILFIAILVIRRKTRYYEEELSCSKQDLEKMIRETEEQINELQKERNRHELLLADKELELSNITKRNQELETRERDIQSRVAAIVRYRNSALKELYQDIRVRFKHESRRSVVPLISLIKDLNEKKQILNLTPRDSFWENLRKSVDGEFQGIATFVEQSYPSLSSKDMHFFLLLCANISPQIIKICMNYSSAVTVSNYKRTFLKEKFGLDIKFEDFINLYLKGELK